MFREAGDEMNHMRMQQHTRRPPVQQARDTDEDILNEGEYDDAWPVRMPSSTRRYQSLPDVRSETGRREVDGQPATGQRFYTPGSPYERHTAIPPRRTATQSSLPVDLGDARDDVVELGINGVGCNVLFRGDAE